MKKDNIFALIKAYMKDTYNVQPGDTIKLNGEKATISDITVTGGGNIFISLESNGYSRYISEDTFAEEMKLSVPAEEEFWIARDCIGLALCLEEPKFDMGVLIGSVMVYIPDTLFPEIKLYGKRKVKATTIIS